MAQSPETKTNRLLLENDWKFVFSAWTTSTISRASNWSPETCKKLSMHNRSPLSNILVSRADIKHLITSVTRMSAHKNFQFEWQDFTKQAFHQYRGALAIHDSVFTDLPIRRFFCADFWYEILKWTMTNKIKLNFKGGITYLCHNLS